MWERGVKEAYDDRDSGAQRRRLVLFGPASLMEADAARKEDHDRIILGKGRGCKQASKTRIGVKSATSYHHTIGAARRWRQRR